MPAETRIEYAGYTIYQSDHCGAAPGQPGWMITKGGVNPMPGATFAESKERAFQLVDVLEAVGGDAQKFWHLLRAINGHSSAGAIDYSQADTKATDRQVSRLTVTGRVYQMPASGQPYTVIVVDGQEVRVNLVRANPALPVEIPPESPQRWTCSVTLCGRNAEYEVINARGDFEGATVVCIGHAQDIVASREFGAISRIVR